MHDQKIYTFYSDPGHAWLEVTRTEIKKLGLADQISSCSYQHEKHVYLEEDCDMPLFVKAQGWNPSSSMPIREVFQDQTPIRGYQPYSP